jgi:predicted nucleic acid-binding protein
MDKIVVDTDVLIDYLRTGSGLLPYLLSAASTGTATVYCPTIVILEIFSGQSAAKTEPAIEELLASFRIVSLDENIAKIAGRLRRDNRLQIGSPDLITAATALSLDAPLAIHNARHFSPIPGLKILPAKKIMLK